jgi:prephenate dehydrogenase
VDRKYKTTKKDFKVFCDSVYYWINEFGLKGWHLYFEHVYLENSLAQVTYNIITRIATFKLSTIWDIPVSNRDINLRAFHEVLELLLSRLNILAKLRFINEGEIDEELHNIIRIFENIFFK